jgi:hypothetical protein
LRRMQARWGQVTSPVPGKQSRGLPPSPLPVSDLCPRSTKFPSRW